MKIVKLCCLMGILFSTALHAESYTSPGYAVVSGHPLATKAGLNVLSEGGNAFDAAIAVSAVLGVVAPYHSGLGGGGFWLLYEAKTHKNSFIDAREVAPLAAKKDMFLDSNGEPVPGLSLNGGLAAAIPGQPAAMAYIASHYGKLPLQKSLARAIELAENGFIIDHQFWFFTTMGDRLQQLKRFSGSTNVFLQNGRPYPVGARLKQKDLAHTLEILAEHGHNGFYQGEIAKKLVQAVNQAGGIWSLEDLQRYKIKLREPLTGAYHNMLIITAPPPSAGGVALLTMMHILANYSLETFAPATWVHYLVESMRLAYWQRNQYLGDPDFVAIPLDRLLSAENAKKLAVFIMPDKATSSKHLPQVTDEDNESKNTTHLSIIDAEGNRVAATLTVNYIFGSSVVAEDTGVLLNDEMDDFSSKVGAKNVFGIVGSEVNAIAPGKRPLSNMTPTFLEMPGRVAIFGTPGGSRIPTMTLLAALAFHDSYGAITMISRMRFHHQYLPDKLQFEPETFSVSMQEKLQKMGYKLDPLAQYYGDMQAITWDKKNHLLTAASDPRHIGLAVSVTSNERGYGLNH